MMLRRLLILGILLPLAGCGGGLGSLDSPPSCTGAATEVTRVRVYPGAAEVLPTGQPFQMVAQAFNSCGDPVSGVNFSWSSSNPSVSVSGTGMVRGLRGGGTATITATAVVSGLAQGRQAASTATPGQSALQFAFGSVDDRTISRVTMYPPDPVTVAAGFQLQMSALAFNKFNQVIPGVGLSWISTQSNIASIVSNSGLISANNPGSTTIRVAPTALGTFNSTATATVVVRGSNGAPTPDPVVVLNASNVVVIAGETGRVFAQLRNPETQVVTLANFTWQASATGVVALAPSPDTDFVDITGLAPGNVTLMVSASANGVTYTGTPIQVRVLINDPAISSNWTQAAPLSIPTTGLGLSASGDYLVATGGVTGSNFIGGPREQVMRARMVNAGGTLFSADGTQGWDQSESGDVITLLEPCTVDPACMTIFRDPAGNIPARTVRYQVFGHGQVATDSHVYVIGGIDAQVDLGAIDPASTGVTGPIGIGAVGPNDTRFSDRVLIASVGAGGAIADWTEGPRLPQVGLISGDTDIPGTFAPGVARYRDWIYVTGGWGASTKANTGQIVGRNRDEVFRAQIRPDGTLSSWQLLPLDRLPQPLNKHGAAVVEVSDFLTGARRAYLVISGGSTGADQSSATSITDQVWFARLDPLSGDFLSGWTPGSPLPRPLEFQAMVNIPGTDILLVTGGDDIASSSRESYLIHVNFSNGVAGSWTRLPLLPNLGGMTALSAAGVSQVAGQPLKRVYVAGGGALTAGTDFELARSGAVYYIDIN